MIRPSAKNSLSGCLLALCIFIILSMAWLYPLSFSPATRIQDSVDSLFNAWTLAWDAHSFSTNPLNIFQANIFFPAQYTLAFSEHLLGIAVFAWPIIALTKNPVLAHNLMLIFSFIMSGFGVFLLVRKITHDYGAGILAGVLFAFCPYRLMQLGHLQVLSIQWLAFIFLFLHRYKESKSWFDLGLFFCFLTLQCLSCGYYALFVLLLLLFAFPLLFGLNEFKTLRFWKQNTVFSLLFILLIIPVFRPYFIVRDLQGLKRSFAEVELFSADLMDFMASPIQKIVLGDFLRKFSITPEGFLFPGFILLLFAFMAMILWWRNRKEKSEDQKSYIEFIPLYLGLVLIAFSFALGPLIKLNGQVLFTGPYNLLYLYVPGFSGLRVPARMAMPMMLFLSVLAGFSLAYLKSAIDGKKRRILFFSVISILILVDIWHWPLPNQGHFTLPWAKPAYVDYLADNKAKGACWHFPLGTPKEDMRFVYSSVFHWRPLVNGYSGHFPKAYQALASLTHYPCGRGLIEQASEANVRFVLVHFNRYADKKLAGSVLKSLRSMPDLVKQGPVLDNVFIFELKTVKTEELAITKAHWKKHSALPNNNESYKAFDNDPKTCWSSLRPQRPKDRLTGMWSSPRMIKGLDFSLGEKWQDYPRKPVVSLRIQPKKWIKPVLADIEITDLFKAMAKPKAVSPSCRVIFKNQHMCDAFSLRLKGVSEFNWLSICDTRLLTDHTLK